MKAKAGKSRKFVGLTFILIAVIALVCCIGITRNMGEPNTLTANAEETEHFPQEIDTDIRSYVRWGTTETSMTDNRVYKETTLLGY